MSSSERDCYSQSTRDTLSGLSSVREELRKILMVLCYVHKVEIRRDYDSYNGFSIVERRNNNGE